MSRHINDRTHFDQMLYRVWPDGTVQDTDREAYNWKSDDYVLVWAFSEHSAYLIAKGQGCA